MARPSRADKNSCSRASLRQPENGKIRFRLPLSGRDKRGSLKSHAHRFSGCLMERRRLADMVLTSQADLNNIQQSVVAMPNIDFQAAFTPYPRQPEIQNSAATARRQMAKHLRQPENAKRQPENQFSLFSCATPLRYAGCLSQKNPTPNPPPSPTNFGYNPFFFPKKSSP